MSLKGKVAIVTGGSQAVVLGLAEAGPESFVRPFTATTAVRGSETCRAAANATRGSARRAERHGFSEAESC